ncbi:ABC transporter ATP-binding protein [Lapillicoccus jejuensis]|uniref:ATP-binding cassette subfamily B protein n=1 Tax=Lapillicoccus jejuensis TaxID=402171 RepID=A0A542DYU9_9MICO|nr:ABC transporter ATP-binding protein [Lapillicoccus jejuensis]TQJ08258.1 ATP-binding cassette subfamily B protein [Lapillicoccus jejuensis]
MTSTPRGATRLLLPVARPHLPALGRATGLVVLRGLAVLARPWPLAIAVDAALEPTHRPLPLGLDRPLGGLPPLGVVLLAALAGVLVSVAVGALDLAVDLTAESAAERLGADLRRDAFAHALGRSLRWHDAIRSAELVTRLTTDVGRLLDAVVALATSLLPDVVLLVAVLVVIAHLDLGLAVVALGIVPLLGVLAVEQRQRVRSAQAGARTASGALATTTQDLLHAVRTVQAFGREDRATRTFGRRNETLLRAQLHAVRVEARWLPTGEIVLALGGALVLATGGTHVLAGTLSVGTLLVVVAYVRDLYAPVRSLTRLSGVLAKAGASAARVAEVVDTDDGVADRPGATDLRPPVHGIRLEDVRFGYDPGAPVLDGLDLELEAGRVTALVGPSGAGKSTVLQLLLRLYDVDAGRVLVDGTDLRCTTRRSLTRVVGYLPQDPWLLDASLADNIAYGAPAPSPSAVRDAARVAHVEEFLDELPDGLDTVLGQDAARLSGGQRRRVALARAVVGGAPVLLLDEPTASLDDESARVVVDAIRSVARGRTVVVVTHDERVAAVADRVVRLERRRPLDPTDHPDTPEGGEPHDHHDPRPGAARTLALAQPVTQPLARLSD